MVACLLNSRCITLEQQKKQLWLSAECSVVHLLCRKGRSRAQAAVAERRVLRGPLPLTEWAALLEQRLWLCIKCFGASQYAELAAACRGPGWSRRIISVFGSLVVEGAATCHFNSPRDAAARWV